MPRPCLLFNQPNLKESTSGLVITGSEWDSLYGGVVSLLGKAGDERGGAGFMKTCCLSLICSS